MGITVVPREIEDNGNAKFLNVNKVHYGLCENGQLRLSILSRIMEIEEGVNTLQDLHNSSYDTKAEFNNCLIIHSK